jgi:hypothetical protein
MRGAIEACSLYLTVKTTFCGGLGGMLARGVDPVREFAAGLS